MDPRAEYVGRCTPTSAQRSLVHMQPAVLAALVLPRPKDVDAVKRAEQLVGAPECLKHLHEASVTFWLATGSLSTAMPCKVAASSCQIDCLRWLHHCARAGTATMATDRHKFDILTFLAAGLANV